MADLPGIDEERAEQARIAASGKIVRSDNSAAPEGFVAGLFARAVPEDVMRYDAREVSELAADAWALLATRKPGTSNIRYASPRATAGHPRLKSVSVLEIVNDDMPFLLDSVMGELTERGIEIHLVLHPVFTVERDGAGELTAFKGTQPHPAPGALRESFIHIHTERIEDEGKRAEVVAALEQVLSDIRLCVRDWRTMMARVGEVIAELKSSPPPLPVDEIAEAIQFLEWLVGNNFTFLSIRNY